MTSKSVGFSQSENHHLIRTCQPLCCPKSGENTLRNARTQGTGPEACRHACHRRGAGPPPARAPPRRLRVLHQPVQRRRHVPPARAHAHAHAESFRAHRTQRTPQSERTHLARARGGWQAQSLSVCVCVCVCARARLRACVRACIGGQAQSAVDGRRARERAEAARRAGSLFGVGG